MKSINPSKVDILLEKAKTKEKDLTYLSTPDEGFQHNESGDWLYELYNFAVKYMNKYDIGERLSQSKWGHDGVSKVKRALRKSLSYTQDDGIKRKKSQQDLYKDLRKDFKDEFSAGQVAVAARTEMSRMRSVIQLEKWKESGLSFVRHVTRNDSKVSKACRLYGGQVFEIDRLLKKSGESDRVPIHPNCRCRYEPVWKNMP